MKLRKKPYIQAFENRIYYKRFPQDVQEHYLNLKYQIGDFEAKNYLFLVDIIPLIFNLEVGRMALNIMTNSLKKAKII